MKRLVYVIGEPGVGKSSTTGAALGPGYEVSWPGDPRLIYTYHGNGYHHLGTLRQHFGGVSSLQSKDALDTVIRWLEETKPSHVIGEGNKLIRNDKLFVCALGLGYKLDIIWLQAPRETASSRRAVRGESITQKTLKKYGDPNPDAGWVKIVVRNVARVTDRWGKYLRPINADRPLNEVAAEMQAILEEAWRRTRKSEASVAQGKSGFWPIDRQAGTEGHVRAGYEVAAPRKSDSETGLASRF